MLASSLSLAQAMVNSGAASWMADLLVRAMPAWRDAESMFDGGLSIAGMGTSQGFSKYG